MPKIISVSRRNDIPAFHGRWFMDCLIAGKADWKNPYSGKIYTTPLGPDDVTAFAFWSKNFSPFMKNISRISDLGYHQIFNYTITGLPRVFEPFSPGADESIERFRLITNKFSPEHINWRYDPIIISSITPRRFHIENFTRICRSLEGYAVRCYISFVSRYGKVEKKFKQLHAASGIMTDDIPVHEKISLASELAGIAAQSGISVYSCCNDFLADANIKKGHCIDRDVIKSITGTAEKIKLKGTREQCGCAESTDIGFYGNCAHGCIYCYAN